MIQVRLEPYTSADQWLIEAIETDPVAMRFLGGPVPREEIPRIHARRLGHIRNGAWYDTIVVEPHGPVGSIGIWASDWEGEPMSEIGWTILPAFWGRGYATAALRLMLARARENGRWGAIHAIPAADNVASNALCRSAGFMPVGVGDIDYAGHPLHVKHWVLELSPVSIQTTPDSTKV